MPRTPAIVTKRLGLSAARIARRVSKLLATVLFVAAASSAASIADAASALSFGGVTLPTNRLDLLTSMGGATFQIVGNAVTWSVLAPNGRDFDATALRSLDQQVRAADAAGIERIVFRLRPGGGPIAPFAGPESSWPVDPASYDAKNGEYLGPKYPIGTYSYPPRVLTRDEPGNTSPWYQFVFALARRYDGSTPDPQNPTKKLPRVAAWSCVEEPDVKSYWYGTASDYFGGVGGDPRVGTLPSFYRAVKAAQPTAAVIGGALTSHQLGYRLAHDLARAHGNRYDAEVRAWGTRYFSTSYPLQRVFAANVPDATLFTQIEQDRESRRARNFIDALFAGSAPDFYDVLGLHHYDDWSTLDDVIEFHRARSRGIKPMWITELGIADQPPPGTKSWVSESDQAVWLAKKLTVALALGVEHVSFAPVLGVPGFAAIHPSATSERLARRTLQLFGRTLRAGYSVADATVDDDATRVIFEHRDGRSQVVVQFASRPAHSRALTGGTGASDSSRRSFDVLGRPVTAEPSGSLAADSPILTMWGPGIVDADGDGYPAPFDCDDGAASVNPGATDGGSDPRDDDCDPITR